MIDNLKKILNEDQDPKAIEKINAKLDNLLMSNEEIGYIAVQKKPAVTIFPDSIVVTNKRIIICKPKNLGLSMEFVDYGWDDITSSFVKENILGAEFSFNTKFELTHTIDYLPKNQARKLYTYTKEQLDILKNGIPVAATTNPTVETINTSNEIEDLEELEETPTEEVTNFAEIIPATTYNTFEEPKFETATSTEKGLGDLSQDELFAKLQNYKKLLDNGLIMQGEYDNLKKEILSFM
ncbi:PH domain-containing protein [Flavobacterium sp. SUN052]|uniref:PH domain-containing protein n=1 Tax=Flavobacterium sp. SUN052 TaxID=3002441 RepID=UPI00237E1D01|nr:PH domain-containing protein [Flavobacterium sp. SUN052]MEC4004000.1 PH domain-containing protein [Flavobacterium sp. SUN052]